MDIRNLGSMVALGAMMGAHDDPFHSYREPVEIDKKTGKQPVGVQGSNRKAALLLKSQRRAAR